MSSISPSPSPSAAARAWAIGPIRLSILRNLHGRGSITTLLLSKGTFEEAAGAMYEYFDYSDWRLLRDRVTNLQRLDLYKRSVRHLRTVHPADPPIASYLYSFPFLRSCSGFNDIDTLKDDTLASPPFLAPRRSFRLYIHPGDPFGRTTATVVPSSPVLIDATSPSSTTAEAQLECYTDYDVDRPSVVPKGIQLQLHYALDLTGDTARSLLEAWPKGLGPFAKPLESLASHFPVGMDKVTQAAAYVAYHRPSGIPRYLSVVETVSSTKQLRQLLKHCRGLDCLDLSGRHVRVLGSPDEAVKSAMTLGTLLAASDRDLAAMRTLKHLTLTLREPRLSAFRPRFANMADFMQAAASKRATDIIPETVPSHCEPLALHSLTLYIAVPFTQDVQHNLVFGLVPGVVDTSLSSAQRTLLDLVTPTRAHVARLVAFGGEQCTYTYRLALPGSEQLRLLQRDQYKKLNDCLVTRVQAMVTQEKARMRLERDGEPGTGWRKLSAEERVGQ